MSLYRSQGETDPSAGVDSRRAVPATPRHAAEPQLSADQEQVCEVLDQRLRALRIREDRVRAMLSEARILEGRAEVRLAEARDIVARENNRGQQTGTRSSAARDHELAQMRARLISGETAGAELAERLRLAHLQAGKPNLTRLGAAVGYSKATLSKVFNNRMAPTWKLVRKLGLELRVPTSHVMQEWLPRWIAAGEYRHQHQTPACGRATVPLPSPVSVADTVVQDATAALTQPTGHTCPKCGSWVVDAAQHADWHMSMEPGAPPPAAESLGERWPPPGWNGDPASLTVTPGILRSDGEGDGTEEVLSDMLRQMQVRKQSDVTPKTELTGLAEKLGLNT